MRLLKFRIVFDLILDLVRFFSFWLLRNFSCLMFHIWINKSHLPQILSQKLFWRWEITRIFDRSIISVLYSSNQSRRNMVRDSLLIRIQSRYRFKNQSNRLKKMNNHKTPAILFTYVSILLVSAKPSKSICDANSTNIFFFDLKVSVAKYKYAKTPNTIIKEI